MYNPKKDIAILFEYAKHNKKIVCKDNSIKLNKYIVTAINWGTIGCILGLLVWIIKMTF